MIPALATVVGVHLGGGHPWLESSRERLPESLRGRVVGLTNTLAFSAAPLGILSANWSSSTLGLRSTLMIFAGLYFVLVVAALLSRSLADLNTGTGTEGSGRCSGRLRAITASATVDPEGTANGDSGAVATSGPEATSGPVAR